MEKASIEEVLKHYGAPTVPTALRWKAIRCPFHSDRSASASVSTGQERFRCFACDVNGDAIDIVQWKEGFRDFASAAEFVESITGTSVRTVRDGPTGKRRRKTLSGDSAEDRGDQRTIFSSRVRRKPLAGS